jgi:hypothetical protein
MAQFGGADNVPVDGNFPVHVDFYLNEHSNATEALASIDSVEQKGTPTQQALKDGQRSLTADTLHFVRSGLLASSNGGRPNGAAQVVMIILGSTVYDPQCQNSGDSTCTDPWEAAAALRDSGVTVIVVGVDVADNVALRLATSSKHIAAIEWWTALGDESLAAKLVQSICEVPHVLVPGSSLQRALRTCETSAFVSACPLPRFLARAKKLEKAGTFEVFTAANGLPSVINNLNHVLLDTNVGQTQVVVSTTLNGDGLIRVAVAGRFVNQTVVQVDAWFDRYEGYTGEILSGSALRSGAASGKPVYSCPNDGMRDEYSIAHDTTDGQFSISSETGILSVNHDVTIPGEVRIRAGHISQPCLVSFIDITVQQVLVVGFVYIDFDGSGSMDADEQGLSGLVVTLTSRRGGGAIYTETDSTGTWKAEIEFGATIATIDIAPLNLVVTEGSAVTPMVVTSQLSSFPTIGLKYERPTTPMKVDTTTTGVDVSRVPHASTHASGTITPPVTSNKKTEYVSTLVWSTPLASTPTLAPEKASAPAKLAQTTPRETSTPKTDEIGFESNFKDSDGNANSDANRKEKGDAAIGFSSMKGKGKGKGTKGKGSTGSIEFKAKDSANSKIKSKRGSKGWHDSSTKSPSDKMAKNAHSTKSSKSSINPHAKGVAATTTTSRTNFHTAKSPKKAKVSASSPDYHQAKAVSASANPSFDQSTVGKSARNSKSGKSSKVHNHPPSDQFSAGKSAKNSKSGKSSKAHNHPSVSALALSAQAKGHTHQRVLAIELGGAVAFMLLAVGVATLRTVQRRRESQRMDKFEPTSDELITLSRVQTSYGTTHIELDTEPALYQTLFESSSPTREILYQRSTVTAQDNDVIMAPSINIDTYRPPSEMVFFEIGNN